MCGFLPQPVFRIPEPGQYRNPIYAVLQGVSRMGEGRSKMKESWGGGRVSAVYMYVHLYMRHILQMYACVHKETVFVFTLIPSGPDSGSSWNTSPRGMGTGDLPTDGKALPWAKMELSRSWSGDGQSC